MNKSIKYRNYYSLTDNIKSTYHENHISQTLYHVKSMLDIHCVNFDKCLMDIKDVIMLQNEIIDESDPDFNGKQIIHAYQTAEAARKMFPNEDYMHLVGLIHDCGKVLLLDKFGKLPQWNVVGDIFPVGCEFSDKIVYPEFFFDNPDKYDKYGIYSEKCGIDNLYMSFSHDIYLYSVLKYNNCLIPENGLKVIKYHSFYSWHKENEYEYFMNDDDYVIRNLCKKFSECDLYSKNNDELDVLQLKDYYDSLINKYFSNSMLKW